MMGDSFRTSEKYPHGSFYYAGGYKILGDEIVCDTGSDNSLRIIDSVLLQNAFPSNLFSKSVLNLKLKRVQRQHSL